MAVQFKFYEPAFSNRPVNDLDGLKAINTNSHTVTGVDGTTLNIPAYVSGALCPTVVDGMWLYVAGNVEIADDLNIVQPTVGDGRWFRITLNRMTQNEDGTITGDLIPIDGVSITLDEKGNLKAVGGGGGGVTAVSISGQASSALSGTNISQDGTTLNIQSNVSTPTALGFSSPDGETIIESLGMQTTGNILNTTQAPTITKILNSKSLNASYLVQITLVTLQVFLINSDNSKTLVSAFNTAAEQYSLACAEIELINEKPPVYNNYIAVGDSNVVTVLSFDGANLTQVQTLTESLVPLSLSFLYDSFNQENYLLCADGGDNTLVTWKLADSSFGFYSSFLVGNHPSSIDVCYGWNNQTNGQVYIAITNEMDNTFSIYSFANGTYTPISQNFSCGNQPTNIVFYTNQDAEFANIFILCAANYEIDALIFNPNGSTIISLAAQTNLAGYPQGLIAYADPSGAKENQCYITANDFSNYIVRTFFFDGVSSLNDKFSITDANIRSPYGLCIAPNQNGFGYILSVSSNGNAKIVDISFSYSGIYEAAVSALNKLGISMPDGASLTCDTNGVWSVISNPNAVYSANVIGNSSSSLITNIINNALNINPQIGRASDLVNSTFGSFKYNPETLETGLAYTQPAVSQMYNAHPNLISNQYYNGFNYIVVATDAPDLEISKIIDYTNIQNLISTGTEVNTSIPLSATAVALDTISITTIQQMNVLWSAVATADGNVTVFDFDGTNFNQITQISINNPTSLAWTNMDGIKTVLMITSGTDNTISFYQFDGSNLTFLYTTATDTAPSCIKAINGIAQVTEPVYIFVTNQTSKTLQVFGYQRDILTLYDTKPTGNNPSAISVYKNVNNANVSVYIINSADNTIGGYNFDGYFLTPFDNTIATENLPYGITAYQPDSTLLTLDCYLSVTNQYTGRINNFISNGSVITDNGVLQPSSLGVGGGIVSFNNNIGVAAGVLIFIANTRVYNIVELMLDTDGILNVINGSNANKGVVQGDGTTFSIDENGVGHSIGSGSGTVTNVSGSDANGFDTTNISNPSTTPVIPVKFSSSINGVVISDGLGNANSVAIGSAGQVLTVQTGGSLAFDTPATGDTALSQLTDVQIASQTNGQVLIWSSTDSKWENKSIATATTDENGICRGDGLSVITNPNGTLTATGGGTNIIPDNLSIEISDNIYQKSGAIIIGENINFISSTISSDGETAYSFFTDSSNNVYCYAYSGAQWSSILNAPQATSIGNVTAIESFTIGSTVMVAVAGDSNNIQVYSLSRSALSPVVTLTVVGNGTIKNINFAQFSGSSYLLVANYSTESTTVISMYDWFGGTFVYSATGLADAGLCDVVMFNTPNASTATIVSACSIENNLIFYTYSGSIITRVTTIPTNNSPKKISAVTLDNGNVLIAILFEGNIIAGAIYDGTNYQILTNSPATIGNGLSSIVAYQDNSQNNNDAFITAVSTVDNSLYTFIVSDSEINLYSTTAAEETSPVDITCSYLPSTKETILIVADSLGQAIEPWFYKGVGVLRIVRYKEYGTWIPADASSGGLTFTNIMYNYYSSLVNFVSVGVSFTYPTTNNGADAEINGLPVYAQFKQPINAMTLVNYFPIAGYVDGYEIFFYNPTTGVQYLNSDLSGLTIVINASYQGGGLHI